MRKPRFTFKNAFHHVMNRGYNKSNIFPDNEDKLFFRSILYHRAKLLKIRIFAYCIMDNHYHLILQNSSEKLSDFMRQLNSIYATYYRKKYGGFGYVFQDRYKSTLIQDEIYLKTAILYTLLNPVRANITTNILDYPWSSAHEYFSNNNTEKITDYLFVEEIITHDSILNSSSTTITLKIIHSPIGNIIGEKEYAEKIINKKNRRDKIIHNNEITIRRRKYEYQFRNYKKVIVEFEKKNKILTNQLRRNNRTSAKYRIKLLILLRELCGMKYSEINKLYIFNMYKLSSLSVLYNRHSTNV